MPTPPRSSTHAPNRQNDSGISIAPEYDATAVSSAALARITPAGSFPFTRGPYSGMYRTRPWTMRQYAGFGTAAATNERFRYLLARGQTGLSVAFDLPTQLGLDSDDPRSEGEVGRTGVAIDSIDDMRLLFHEIPLDQVSTSMTINAPAAVLLLLYDLVAEEQGVPTSALRGTIQNDILKEYAARGNYIFPVRPSMRLTTDTFAWCATNAPRFNTISISGYHIREAGSSAAQEIAFTIANGIAYVEAALAAGLDVETFAPRLSFFFNAHNDFFQEVAKFRAARVLWAHTMRDRFGATSTRAQRLRFHAQTGGSTLTAQQPHNNVVRVAIQAFAAACGGAQSIHTNGFDEALALPTEESAELALRTQQILAAESGVTDTIDPLGGSFYIESLTDSLLAEATARIAEISELGGAVATIESGWMQDQIAESAWNYQTDVEDGTRPIVGLNVYANDAESVGLELHHLDPELERQQVDRIATLRNRRDSEAARGALAAISAAAAGDDNVLIPLRAALAVRCTVGEVCSALRSVWGTFDRA